tara:strand:+ start:710 stop:1177 length:468 start_codon:yes stop_codon:yes gene_type:complete
MEASEFGIVSAPRARSPTKSRNSSGTKPKPRNSSPTSTRSSGLRQTPAPAQQTSSDGHLNYLSLPQAEEFFGASPGLFIETTTDYDLLELENEEYIKVHCSRSLATAELLSREAFHWLKTDIGDVKDLTVEQVDGLRASTTRVTQNPPSNTVWMP